MRGFYSTSIKIPMVDSILQKAPKTPMTENIQAHKLILPPKKVVQSNQVTITSLLKKNLFDEALEYYLNSDDAQLEAYKKEIIKYLENRAKIKPMESINELKQFIEIESEDREALLLLIKLYKETKQYSKALETITYLQEYSSEEFQPILKKLYMQISQLYIEELEKSREYDTLMPLLEQLSDEYTQKSYYLFKLASLHYKLHQYSESKQYLETLSYDTLYEKQASDLLQQIEQDQETLQEYNYKIPLKREGLHFSVSVVVDGIYDMQLLLDTGATYTLLDNSKVSGLKLIKENITLQTASESISADLAQASSFNLDTIEIDDMQVTLAPFTHSSCDGLLGMNFFKRYKFLIDQEEGVLYLKNRR